MNTMAVRFPVSFLFALLLTGTLFLASCDSAEAPKGSVFETEPAASSQTTGAPGATETAQQNDIQVPVPGMVTMVDLGAESCMPCRMMAPVLDKVARDYRDRAAVVYIDLARHPGQSQRFGIRAMPTQIFYDKTGREIGRHEGFMDRAAIAEVLDKLLAQ